MTLPCSKSRTARVLPQPAQGMPKIEANKHDVPNSSEIRRRKNASTMRGFHVSRLAALFELFECWSLSSMMSLALSIHRSRGNAYRVSAPNSNSLLIQALSFARERVSCLANGAVTLAHIIAPDEFVFQPCVQKCRFSPSAEHVNPLRRSHPDQARKFCSHGESLKVGGR